MVETSQLPIRTGNMLVKHSKTNKKPVYFGGLATRGYPILPKPTAVSPPFQWPSMAKRGKGRCGVACHEAPARHFTGNLWMFLRFSGVSYVNVGQFAHHSILILWKFHKILQNIIL